MININIYRPDQMKWRQETDAQAVASRSVEPVTAEASMPCAKSTMGLIELSSLMNPCPTIYIYI